MLAAILAVRVWRRTGSRAGAWAAATFASLATVVVVGRFLPQHPHGGEVVAQRFLIALLVLFPYFLYRFTTAFRDATPLLERLVAVLTAAMVVWTFALPSFPAAGEPRSADFWAYLVGFVVHWTVLTAVSASRLWRAGHGQPGVARRRMRLLAGAAVAITAALFAAIPGGKDGSVISLVGACILTISGIAFALALDPPGILRALWRRPEQERLQQAVVGLLRAENEADVAEGVIAPMARLVGASTVLLVARDGRTIGSYGSPAGHERDEAPHRLEIGEATLHVWTSRTTPFFGVDELELLTTLGSLTALALDRARLLGHERDVRAQLERADEIKTQFVAYAAHELRTPITTVVGLIETLDRRSEQLTAEMRHQLTEALGLQARRLRMLVEQLLDLSRLDADAVEIHPETVDVRAFAEGVVETVTGGAELPIQLTIAAGLSAEVDRAALGLILTNLVTNALRYGRPPISIGASAADGQFRLTVEDAGGGVSPAFVPQLFERFARSEEAQRIEGGSGLGLAIARSYARAHRGDLVYAPARRGARFELLLPR